MDIKKFVKLKCKEESNERIIFEGSCDVEELSYFKNLIKNNNIKEVLEIGFNYGVSTDNFFKSDNKLKVLSFDLGKHGYEKYGKEYIDLHYPDKHELIIGDSQVTIPDYISDKKYDLIFIDGGHSYKCCKNDFNNILRFCNNNTIIVIDDTCGKKPYSKGPRKVVDELLTNNIITDLKHYENYKQTRHWSEFKLL
ncbi:MAG: putative O-methyltransferase YrrM [Alphaproteobacteria bacterium]|jgi:predicted O-methyltransferase YrrM